MAKLFPANRIEPVTEMLSLTKRQITMTVGDDFQFVELASGDIIIHCPSDSPDARLNSIASSVANRIVVGDAIICSPSELQ